MVFALPVLAVLITLPALRHGLLIDDLTHRAHLLDPARKGEPLRNSGIMPENASRLSAAMANLFVFLPAEKMQWAIHNGHLPWWTYEGCKAAFWRPLTSLSLWLDYQLYPDWPAMMRIHSLLWFAAAILLLTILYRRLMGPTWIAGLAALLYVLDENTYITVALIAHRNSLMALVFGLLGLLAYHRWRSDGWLAGAILAPLCLAMSLLSAEAGLGAAAYLAAYALILDRSKWCRRLPALLPSVMVVVLWRLLYTGLGYGVCAGRLYMDPGADPLAFAGAVAERAPILLLGQWCVPPAFVYNYFSDSARQVYWLAAVAFFVFVLAMLVPLLRRNRVARFWLVGSLLAVIPICATIPWGRNLVFVGIGAMGLTAQFVAALFRPESCAPARCLYRWPAWALCALVLLAQIPFAGLVRAVWPAVYSNSVNSSAEFVRVDSPPVRADQDLVVVRAPVPMFFLALPIYCDAEGRPIPRSVAVLAGIVPIEVTRTDARTLRVRAVTGNLLWSEQREDIPLHWAYFLHDFNSTLRDEQHPMQPGRRMKLKHMSVEVTHVDADGMPVEAVFRFPANLDDPSLRWVQISKDHLNVPFAVPAVGQTVLLPGPY